MRRPLLSHKNSHIVFREKGGSRFPVLTHSFSQFCTAPSPHRALAVFANGNLGVQAMISTSMRPYEGRGLGSSLFSWLKGQRPLWSQKKAEVDTESYLVLCQHAEAANVRRPITQVTPLIAIGTCLCGLSF